MKKIILFSTILSLNILSSAVAWAAAPAELKHTPERILEFVLAQKNKPLNPQIAIPKIYVASKTSLKQFQDAIEKQWGFRPDLITNAFVVEKNEIYLLDDAEYYQKAGRCMDDSLAHELVHYVQTKYQNYDLNDESLEWEAVDIQTRFREAFCPVK